MAVRRNSLCMLTISSLLFSIVLVLSVHGCPPNESRALLSLRATFFDPDGMLKSWVEGNDCCKWRGVHCDESESGGHVTHLDIGGFQLSLDGFDTDIGSALSRLKHLKHLDFSDNDFHGVPLPPAGLASLRNLSYLNIARASFGGDIPSQLGNLSSLRHLDLSSYGVRDKPNLEWLSSLSLLEYLSLRRIVLEDVKTTVWGIIGLLFHLTHLDLSDCFYQSLLPVSLLNQSSLAVVKFSGNGMSGSIPSWIGNMTKLTFVDLSSNALNGTIPTSLSKLHFLEYLDLSKNKIVGIPDAITNLTSLRHLDLSANKLIGIPSGLGSLFNLAYIDLSGNMLAGPIHPSLGNLPSLRSLNLSDNNMSGGIPLSFAQLPALVTLDLRNNQLNGSIPSSLTLPASLRAFLLSNNSMTGTVSIQVLFTKSSSLKELELSYSGLNISIDWGPWIPPFQLETLKLRGCKIGGPIPSWISTQFEIEDVDLSDADLAGNLPSWVWEFSSKLRSLNLSNNHLEGPVTVSVTSISLQLQVLDLSVNELSGPLLLDVRTPGLLSLEILLFADNKIEGPIPASLGALISLVILDLSNNQLWGEIPNFSLGELRSLQVLRLEKNHLNGQIPVGLANLLELVILNLASNELEGEIPEELGELSGLASLHLEKNNLQGLLPSSLAQLSELQVLDIGQNNLTGNIPAWIANCSSLQVLLMRSNNFKGKLPPQIGKMPQLRLLDISSNLLYGEIPNTYFNFSAMVDVKENMTVLGEDPLPSPPSPSDSPAKGISTSYISYTSLRQCSYYNCGTAKHKHDEENKYYIEGLDIITKGSERHYAYVFSSMTSIDFSNNRLWGHLPAAVGNLKGLMFLNLSRNIFIGEIPGTMGSLSQLESLDLSFNKFSGTIPFQLGSLDYLGYLNLSHNNLSGVIPQQGRHMITFDESAFSGNPNLRGCPVESWMCSPHHSPPSPPAIDANKESKETFPWYAVSIGWSIAAGFCVVVLVLTFNVNWRKTTFGEMDRVIAFLLGERTNERR